MPGSFVQFSDPMVANGVRRVQLKLRSGTGKLSIKGLGSHLLPPTLPLHQEHRVRAQLRNDAGGCWESIFVAPTRNGLHNKYQARG